MAEEKNIKGKINELAIHHTDAYQIAVMNGFEGTIAEWLASLTEQTKKNASAVIQEADKQIDRMNDASEAAKTAISTKENEAVLHIVSMAEETLNIVQTTGDSETAVMSQKAVTDEVKKIDVRLKGGGVFGENANVFYYTSLDYALGDIINEDFGNGTAVIAEKAVCAAYYDERNARYVLILLDDITVPQATYDFAVPVEINFAGKFLTFPNCEGVTKWKFDHQAYLNGTIGGGIRGTFSSGTSNVYAMLFRNGCIVDGGTYSLDGEEQNAKMVSLFSVNEGEAIFKNLTCEMTVACTGAVRGLTSCLADKVVVDNVNISVSGTTGVDTTEIHGLYFNNGVEVCVKNTHITALAKSKATRVHGMTLLKGELVELTNNTVYVDAGENSAGSQNGQCGYACYIGGNVTKAVINGGEYEGVMTAISIYAPLALIDGGKFVSCAHGGFYYSAEGGKCYIKNAKIGTCAYSGIFNQSEMGNPNPLGGFYVGTANSAIYVDNCEYLYTDDTQYVGGVLRGDNLNIRLYISNMTIPEGHKLRADNGNFVYVGTGTNITKDNMCIIYEQPIDDATLVYTGYNVYTYENTYTNKKCDIIPPNVANALKATKSGVVVSVDDVSPVSHKVNVGLRVKNFFHFPTAMTKTFGGITFAAKVGTPEFVLSGTATNETSSGILSNFPMVAGQYRVSTIGLASQSGNNRIYVSANGSILANYIYDGSPKEITLTENSNISVQLIISKDSAYDNTNIKIVVERVPVATDETEVTITAVDDVENPTVTRTVTTTIAKGATFESIAPNMTVSTDNEGVDIDVTYNRDINKAFLELYNAIVSLSSIPMATNTMDE